MTAAEDILNANIRHQVYLQRLSTGTVRKIIALLGRVDTKLVERLLREDITSISRKRLDKLLEAVRVINRDAYAVLRKELTDELKGLAAYESGFQARLIGGSVPIALDVITPNLNTLYAAVNAGPFEGRLLKEWFRDLEANAFRRMRDTIRTGVVEGRTTPQLVRDLRGTKANGYRDGILGISRRGAEATVRTAVNHTSNMAKNELYKANSDIIKGIKWVSTLDGRTSAICRGLDGKVFPVDKGPRPPAHINCRSATTPVLKSWKELGISLKEAPEGTRASMNGQVPASLTYNDWLKKQDVAFQEDVLGVKKARLFRRGDLPLDRFTDRTGAEYTLDELAQRETEAFEKAGL